jgi:acetolactate synthase I/II/III large subunit
MAPHSSPRRMTGGQAVVESLVRNGVRKVFGVPGESFMGVLDALYDSPIEFVSTRHEGGAAFMASGHAKISGQVAVCMGTRAVGSSNLAIGIHTARHDSTPMIALAGQVKRAFRGRDAFQELDLVAVFSQYCKWAVEITDAGRVPELMERAFLAARSGRPGPVFVALPEDMLDDAAEMGFPPGAKPAPPQPDPAAMERILAQLLAAERPAILAGGGVLSSEGARDLLLRFAEAAELPVFAAWRRHDVFPNDHRLFLGTAGLGLPQTSWDRLMRTDCLLVIGTRLQQISTRGYSVPGPSTRILQVDIAEESIGHSMPVSMGVVSDAGLALVELLRRIPDPVPGMEARRSSNDADRAAYLEASRPEAVQPPSGTLDPADVMQLLDSTVAPDAIVATDGGAFFGFFSRYFRFHGSRRYVGPTSGAMGYGLPAGIGAKMARPDLPAICIAGDGGYMMTMNELETAVRYGVPLATIVLDNQLYGSIRMQQEQTHPGRIVGTELTTPDLVAVAEAFGARGFRIPAEQDLASALREAATLDRPSVLHVMIDPARLSVTAAKPGALPQPEPMEG